MIPLRAACSKLYLHIPEFMQSGGIASPTGFTSMSFSPLPEFYRKQAALLQE
jgi:hypothetical protein